MRINQGRLALRIAFDVGSNVLFAFMVMHAWTEQWYGAAAFVIYGALLVNLRMAAGWRRQQPNLLGKITGGLIVLLVPVAVVIAGVTEIYAGSYPPAIAAAIAILGVSLVIGLTIHMIRARHEIIL